MALGCLALTILPARAAELTAPLDIPAQPLTAALNLLGRQANIDIIFDQAGLADVSAPAIRGRYSAAAALDRLLAGSGLGFRRTVDGVYVLTRRAAPDRLDAGDGAVAEVLVIGRNSQNADVRRTENDIQPYTIATTADLAEAHPQSINEYFLTRSSQDQQYGASAQQQGPIRSEINLLGLGSDKTLVLVDGRRLPGLPDGANGLFQSNIMALPLNGILRTETLTSSASGIYGPSAVGGVVNVVLRRDFKGPELHVAVGSSTRGDAGRLRAEFDSGFTPDGGQTDVSFATSVETDQAFTNGQMPFLADAGRLRLRNDPDFALASFPSGNAINVYSLSGPLQLSPRFGGAALNADRTFLPLTFAGTIDQAAAVLLANAGKIDEGISPGQAGATSSLVTTPLSASGVLSVRHRFTPSVEGFIDGLYLFDEGRAVVPATVFPGVTDIGAPSNPFNQPVIYGIPTPNLGAVTTTAIGTFRVTGGVIVDLPGGWRASADYAHAQSAFGTRTRQGALNAEAYGQAIETGLPTPGLPAISPLGGYGALVAAEDAYTLQQTVHRTQRTGLDDLSLHVAGPLVALPGGRMTAELTAETYRQALPATTATDAGFASQTAALAQQVDSGRVEVRAPLISSGSPWGPLRGLEAQLAVRYDQVVAVFPASLDSQTAATDAALHNRSSGVTLTFGAKATPAPWLLLRASVATGALPPTIPQLTSLTVTGLIGAGPPDPARGGRPLGSEAPYSLVGGGSPALDPERSRSLSAGIVLNPAGGAGPRLSIDYGRLEEDHAITEAFSFDAAHVLAAAAGQSNRVLRAPLTADDAALGFTGGVVTQVDTRAGNTGQAFTEWVTARLDWSWPIRPGQTLRLYGETTWEPHLRDRPAPGASWVEHVGLFDGPLAVRANVGLDWSWGATRLGVNIQYYDGYRLTLGAAGSEGASLTNDLLQGSDRIAPQAYADLTASHVFPLPAQGPFRTLKVDLALKDLSDARPPIVAAIGSPGYSLYGDPVGRRVQIVLSSQF